MGSMSFRCIKRKVKEGKKRVLREREREICAILLWDRPSQQASKTNSRK